MGKDIINRDGLKFNYSNNTHNDVKHPEKCVFACMCWLSKFEMYFKRETRGVRMFRFYGIFFFFLMKRSKFFTVLVIEPNNSGEVLDCLVFNLAKILRGSNFMVF